MTEAWPKVAFVACTAKKLAGRRTARDLYSASPLFQGCRRQVEAESLPWLIVSTKYGVIAPDQPIESYERDLKRMSPAEVDAWKALMSGQLREVVLQRQIRTAVLLAGKDFRDVLKPLLEQVGVRVTVHPEWSRIVDRVF